MVTICPSGLWRKQIAISRVAQPHEGRFAMQMELEVEVAAR